MLSRSQLSGGLNEEGRQDGMILQGSIEYINPCFSRLSKLFRSIGTRTTEGSWFRPVKKQEREEEAPNIMVNTTLVLIDVRRGKIAHQNGKKWLIGYYLSSKIKLSNVTVKPA